MIPGYLKIEWIKLRNYRIFWLMTGLYLILFFSFILALPKVIDLIAAKTTDPAPFQIFKTIAFNFQDIWQNISFFAGLRWSIKIFPALLIIIFVSNEFSYQTIRSNILSGLSRKQFLLGKLWVAFLLTLISVVALLISGLYLGFLVSANTSAVAILKRMDWLIFYVIELFTYLTFALMTGILIRKSGFAIIFLISYNLIELIIQLNIPETFHKFLPLNAMNGIITGFNTSLISVNSPEINLSEFLQQQVSPLSIIICLAYLALFILIMGWFLEKKDL
jgi:ABC-2 type transport system permease protein